VGGVPEAGESSRAPTDLGCVFVLLAKHLLGLGGVSARQAIDDGTPVAIGSGYTQIGEASLNPQFHLYLATHAAGMTVEEAIVASTYNAAYSLRLSHVAGSLSPGKSADLCVMNVPDYRELPRRAGHHDVALAMRAGKVIYRRPHLAME
jgi:imidazolonepropionase